MLPFHLYPSTNGRSVRKSLDLLNSSVVIGNNLHAGGPIQRAIEHDFESFCTAYLGETCGEIPERLSPKRGNGFSHVCQSLRRGEIALISSNFHPYEADSQSFRQQCYASCLSLLATSFKARTFHLDRACLTVILLYILFEPYSVEQQDASGLQLCQFGQLHSRSHGLRDGIRGSIRVDPFHFHLVLELRENCLKASSSNLEQRSVLADDTAIIISRLLNHIEIAAYSGPMNLEGMAGHGDYPFPSTFKARKEWLSGRETRQTFVDLAQHQERAAASDTDELLQCLDRYKRSRATIRLQKGDVNQPRASIKRVQDTILPIFDPNTEVWYSLERASSLSRETLGQRPPSDEYDGVGYSRDVDDDHVHVESVIRSEGLPRCLQASITKAVAYLNDNSDKYADEAVQRDDECDKVSEKEGFEEPDRHRIPCARFRFDVDLPRDDDADMLPIDDDLSAVGRGALDDLLDLVYSPKKKRKVVSTRARRKSQSSVAPDVDDDVSLQSGLGGMALEQLLEQVEV